MPRRYVTDADLDHTDNLDDLAADPRPLSAFEAFYLTLCGAAFIVMILANLGF